MKDRTKLRAIACFGILGAVAPALVARLAYLQFGRSAPNREVVAGQRQRQEKMDAPRGTIVDRHKRVLAYDRMVMEVRAEARLRKVDGVLQDRAKFADDLASDLALALAAEGGSTSDADRRKLRGRIATAFARDEDATRIDFLVGAEVESAAVLDRLRAMDERRSYLHLHYQRRFARVYPDREATWGVVGFVGEAKTATGQSVPVHRGIEALAGLQPGAAGTWNVWQDAWTNRYWTDDLESPARPAVLETTLDLELQKAAQEELMRAVDYVAERYKSPPEWAAMCVADIESGDVLALASYRDGVEPAAAAFAPLQSLYEPGSVVKPLVFSIALRRGLLDWYQDDFNCRPNGPRGWYVPGSHRQIIDEHLCEDMTPREILVESSNIGAVQVGLRLGREGFVDYLEQYRLGQPTALGIPGEARGRLAFAGNDALREMSQRAFMVYTAPSLSFGYETNVTPIQLLRAYVTLLSGRPRELRMYRRIAVGGRITEVPPPAEGERFLSDEHLALLRDAMRGVVSDEPDATGRWLYKELQEEGRPVVAGKTGTSQRRAGGGWIRTASFAGFAPVEKPRFLAVCVLQKPGAAAFWGGRYAAPAAGRLLLRALSQSLEKRPAHSQVSANVTERRTARLDER